MTVRPAWSTTAGRMFLRLRTTAAGVEEEGEEATGGEEWAGGGGVEQEETEASLEEGSVVRAELLLEGREDMPW